MAYLRARGPVVVAVAIPFLFLHRNYQPGVDAGSLHVDLSDLAVLAVVLAALAHARRPLGPRGTWLAWASLVAVIVLGTAWGAAHYGAYPAHTHAVTAAKWFEYMLLAPAVAVIVRSRRELALPGLALVAWSVAATFVGLLQFFGLVGDLDNTPAGRRKPSFVGTHDFAALSAAVLAYALIVLARGASSERERRVALVAGISGGIGLVLGGAFDSLLGELLAAAGILVVLHAREPRRIGAVVAVLLVCTAGVFAIRASAVADGLKFLGIKQGSGGASTHIQSYRQRVLLAYIGGRMFAAHPLTGVGFEGSEDPYAFEPYLAAAHRRFDQPPDAFPSRRHRWGVQNAYVQSLADMGVLGLAAFLAALLVPAWLAARRGAGDLRALGVALPLLVLGTWNGYGLVAGIPLDALTWLGVGVAAVAATRTEAA